MANIPFHTLYDQVLPYLPGAEPGIVDSTIRKAIREFMKRSAVYREEFVFNTTPGVSAYQLNATFGQVSSLLSVASSNRPDGLPVVTEDGQVRVADGAPRGWYNVLPQVLNIYPTPDAVYEIRANAIITLKQDDVVYPEELLANHGEGIAAGVISMMYSMPGKPWTQRDAAKQYGRVFSSEIKTARATVREGGQPNHSTFQAARRFGA